MTHEERKYIIQKIRARIQELQNILNGVGAGADQPPSADPAAASEDVAVSTQLRDSARRELKLLTGNLGWMESDDAGYCEQCGCDIPVARLLAVPVTRRCIACADKT